MTPSTVTSPTAERKLKVIRTVFDLAEFESNTVGKMVAFKPVADVAEALAELGGDATALIALINKGREARVRDEAANSSEGWFELDDKNALTAEVFNGQITEPKHVNQTVSTLARTIFGLSKSMSAEQKKAAKESAMKMVRETPVIRDGLAKRAAEMNAADEAE